MRLQIAIGIMLLMAACDKGYGQYGECDGGSDSDTGFTGNLDQAPEPCAAVDDGWFGSSPLGVDALECSMSPSDSRRVTCTVALYLAVGHPGDVAVEASGWGVVPWNEHPLNAEAGPWENADLVGDGIVCGEVLINTADIGTWSNGKRYFDIVLTDDSLGLFTSQRIWVEDDGVSIDL